jgi:NitT/TauT family transport system substrate-binding protein
MNVRFCGVVAATLCAATCSLVTQGSSIAWSQELQEINVITPNESSCGPYPQFAADDFGFWAKEGLKVNLLPSETQIPYVAFLQNGDADLIIVDSGAVLQAVDSELPVKVVYEAFNFSPDGIVVPADSPIQSLTELKDKTVGLASDRDQITVGITLGAIGETIQSYNVKTVVVGDSGPVLATSLRDGKIDAFAGGGSDRAGIEAAGLQIRNITPIEVSQNPGNSMLAWGPTLEEKRDIIAKFLRGWAQGQHSGLLDAKLLAAECRSRVPENFENLEVGMRLINNQVFIYQLRRMKDYGEPQPDVWAFIQEAYLKQGEMKEFRDPATFLDDSFIAAANDWKTVDVKKGMKAWKDANPDKLIP